MDYTKVYTKLIESRLLLKTSRILLKKQNIYFESHHILPKCLGGKGNNRCYTHFNIVLLSRKEHVLAHRLLMNIYPKNRKLKISYELMIGIKILRPISERYKPKNSKPVNLTMLGKEHSEESKSKISNSIKLFWKTNKVKYLECTYCGFKSNSSNITRFHNQNCKNK